MLFRLLLRTRELVTWQRAILDTIAKIAQDSLQGKSAIVVAAGGVVVRGFHVPILFGYDVKCTRLQILKTLVYEATLEISVAAARALHSLAAVELKSKHSVLEFVFVYIYMCTCVSQFSRQ